MPSLIRLWIFSHCGDDGTHRLVPSAAEVPAVGVVRAESESLSTLGGYRGMGEGGTIGAIANAFSDALQPPDMHINELPASQELLFHLVHAAASADG